LYIYSLKCKKTNTTTKKAVNELRKIYSHGRLQTLAVDFDYSMIRW